MRKNTARHWLHAGLDLLPLILIPVFMIYSHRHTIDSGSIEVPVNRVVDFNQIVRNGDFADDGLYWHAYYESSVVFDDNCVIMSSDVESNFLACSIRFSHNFSAGHKYYVSGNFTVDTSRNVRFYLGGNFAQSDNLVANSETRYTTIITSDAINDEFGVYAFNGANQTSIIDDIWSVDLTKMFGSGFEPTLDEFNNWYSDEYYDYTLSSKQFLKGYSTQTYDDTDIMSQFTYQLYNSVDKYFNMGNVFNLGGVYDWFNLNIFGGNAPIALYIVWNIVLYEFVMDLLFLLYALFMWFIDMTKRLIEKPLDSIK